MSQRLAGKLAIVVGAGQTAGDGIGSGRAAAILFAREGARVIAVDVNEPSAEETVAMIATEGGAAEAVGADATSDGAQYITGVVLPVDGGISARVGVDPI